MKIKSLISISLFVGLVFLIHFFLNSIFISVSIPLKTLIKTHLFLILITSLVVFICSRILDKAPDKVGFAYLGLVLLKMTASIFYLFPYFSGRLQDSKILVMHFFIVFFIYIVAEVVIIVNQITQLKDK